MNLRYFNGEVLWRNDGRCPSVKGRFKGLVLGYITVNDIPALWPRSMEPMLGAVAVEPPEHIETIDWREGGQLSIQKQSFEIVGDGGLDAQMLKAAEDGFMQAAR